MHLGSCTQPGWKLSMRSTILETSVTSYIVLYHQKATGNSKGIIGYLTVYAYLDCIQLKEGSLCHHPQIAAETLKNIRCH